MRTLGPAFQGMSCGEGGGEGRVGGGSSQENFQHHFKEQSNKFAHLPGMYHESGRSGNTSYCMNIHNRHKYRLECPRQTCQGMSCFNRHGWDRQDKNRQDMASYVKE